MLSLFYAATPILNLTSYNPGNSQDCLFFEVKEVKLTYGNKHQDNGCLCTVGSYF